MTGAHVMRWIRNFLSLDPECLRAERMADRVLERRANRQRRECVTVGPPEPERVSLRDANLSAGQSPGVNR